MIRNDLLVLNLCSDIDLLALNLCSGPNVPVITNGDQAVASVSNLVIGEYKFKLTVKDNEDLESSSQIVVTVKESEYLSWVRNRISGVFRRGGASCDERGT